MFKTKIINSHNDLPDWIRSKDVAVLNQSKFDGSLMLINFDGAVCSVYGEPSEIRIIESAMVRAYCQGQIDERASIENAKARSFGLGERY